MSKPSLIDDIVQSGLCTGCGICASFTAGKVSVALNSEGYLRPIEKSSLSATEKHLLSDICPGINLRHDISSVEYHPLWGPVREVNTGYANHPEIRFAGSSGGVLSALLVYLLEAKIVDYVLHIGASERDPLRNEVKISKSHVDVVRSAGSRYSPSAPLIQIDEYLANPGRFAFVGKPCDVAALRQYARHNSLVDQKVIYMLSFMCAGVPSMEGTYAILNKMKAKKEDVRRFAYRGNGWPGMTRLETHDGSVREIDYATSWGTILNRYLQPRCKICPDGTGEFADVACADAWYGKDGYPDFAEQEGRSLIISRNEKGEALINACAKAGYLITSQLAISEISKMQPYQETRKKMVFSRVLALRVLCRRSPKFSRLGLARAAAMGGFRENIRNFAGMMKRLLRKRAA